MVVLLKALVMGIVEGVTEFLPVSSTGHLILAGSLLDYPERGRIVMEIFIQLGAILAVFWHYGPELRALARRIFHDAAARDLALKVLLAFIPAGIVGVLVHHAIEERLFNPPSVAAALVVGGVIILIVERRASRPAVRDIERTTWGEALGIGVAQVASLVPGVSRAGATIIGGLLAGLSRPVATQFSFYLALPTVSAASIFSLMKSLPLLGKGDIAPLAVGCIAAFVSALLVIRVFLTYVQTHDFRPFGYYRIALGILIYVLLATR